MRMLLFRVAALTGLLACFLGLLVAVLRRDAANLGLTRAVGGSDPGIGVLLTDRKGRADHWGQVEVQALCDLVLTCPSRPSQRIPARTTVLIKPEGAEGLALSSGGGLDLHWTERAIRLMALPPGQTAETMRPVDDRVPPDELPGHRPVFGFDGRRYRGRLVVSLSEPGRLQVVNQLPIEAWLEGMLDQEMGPHWPLEALKAQAIAGRTLALARRLASGADRPGQAAVHLRDGAPDPEYRGTGAGSLVDHAVTGTAGLILVHRGAPFPAFFHPSSGGLTAAIEELDPLARSADGHDLRQVLISAVDPWCQRGCQALDKLASHWQRTVELAPNEVRRVLELWPNELIAERYESGRVRSLVLVEKLPPQRKTMTCGEFTRRLGAERFPSTLWTADSPQEVQAKERGPLGSQLWRITVRGRGHGVGLSQVSAFAMARADWPAARILAAFYRETSLRKEW